MTISKHDFGLVAICAIRYCHGRKSYMPSADPELVNNSPELDILFGELKEKYEWAKQQEWILKPLGYALYYVWKEYDERGELL